jgi:hypothetical protein
MVWLVPVCAFFPTVSLYLGGMKVEPASGNGLQQVIGLLLSGGVFLALWAVLRMVLAGPLGPGLGGVIVPTLMAVLALPIETRVGYLIVGVKMKQVATH